jgi:hypothetical protein
MPRQILEINEDWQLVSNRPALFEIVQEPQIEGNALLINNVASSIGAERIPRNNKNLQLYQPEARKTYMKSDKAVTDTIKPYKVLVDD